MKTGTEIFKEALEYTIHARRDLENVQNMLTNMTRKQVAQLEKEYPEMFEALLGTVTSAIVELEDWNISDNIFNYAKEQRIFDKEIGEWKPLGYYKWDEEDYYNKNGFDEKYYGLDSELFVYLKRDGKIQVQAFGDIEEFERGEYDKVRHAIEEAISGYED